MWLWHNMRLRLEYFSTRPERWETGHPRDVKQGTFKRCETEDIQEMWNRTFKRCETREIQEMKNNSRSNLITQACNDWVFDIWRWWVLLMTGNSGEPWSDFTSSNWTHAYTDESANNAIENGGGAILLNLKNEAKKTVETEKLSSNFSAENNSKNAVDRQR